MIFDLSKVRGSYKQAILNYNYVVEGLRGRLAEAVGAYQPEAEVVFAFVRTDRKLVLFHFTPGPNMPSPPEAYERQQHQPESGKPLVS